MKELKEIKTYKLEDFDVTVNRYLTYAQIQAIANAVEQFDTWSEREQNIDMLVLASVTDISDEELMNYNHDLLLGSGLIDEVKSCVANLYEIYNAIQYKTSNEHIIKEISKALKDNKGAIEGMVKKWRNK